ncbi:hypothetical protein NL676_016543 [Syzygium grande]|nr:hypothetical protein NL676_016543 [Syzygium grande]
MYPRIGSHHGNPAVVPTAGRSSSFHHPAPPPSSSSSSGLGIRVAVKPEYRITPPPQLLPQMGDIPRSNFQFDFDFERKVLAELEKESPDWSRLGLENLPSRSSEALPTSSPAGDPIINKYISSGLSREAVPLAVANYGIIQPRLGNLSMVILACARWGFLQAVSPRPWSRTTTIWMKHWLTF